MFAVYSVRATPFLDAELDLVDLIARVATSVSVFGALVLAAFVYRSADEEDDDAAVEVRPGRHAAADAFDGIIQVTNITALVLFVLLMAYSSKPGCAGAPLPGSGQSTVSASRFTARNESQPPQA